MKLSPGKRVEMIKRLATRLAAEGMWNHIDLVLSEFGLGTSHSWNGTPYEYCLEMLRPASDDSLLRLEAHYFDAGANPDDDGLVWKEGGFRLFISHVSKEKVFATQLASSLWNLYGVHGFVAHEDIEPNREWLRVIVGSLRTSEALVALLHPGFNLSPWTDQEVGYVLSRSRPVLSVRLGIEPYGFFGLNQALAGFGKEPEVLAKEIALALLDDTRTRESTQAALVWRLERSRNFNMSNNLVRMLRDHVELTAEQYGRLRAVQASNVEVGDAFEVAPYLDGISIRYDHPGPASATGDDDLF